MKTTDTARGILRRIKDRLGARRLTLILCALGIVGAALVLFEPSAGGDKIEAVQFDESAYNAGYLENMKLSLESAISSVEGAGRAEVYITLERGVRYVYATESRSSGDETRRGLEDYTESRESESSLVIVDSDSGKQPVVLEREEPAVLGVAVICEGGGDALVRQEIIELASTLCGVGSNRVKVAAMKIHYE